MATFLALALVLVILAPRHLSGHVDIDLEAGDVVTTRRREVLFWALVCAAVVMTLVAHRPDQDDCQFISWAVAAVDHPGTPILHFNTMNAPPLTPLIPFGYRFHSFEILAAAVSILTGIQPIAILHLIFAPIAAALAVWVYRRLFEILSPRFWIYGLVAVLVVLCTNGGAHWAWGNFSFVRLHQTKGILATVILPWIVVAGLRFARHPSRRGWIELAAAQIVALGASFTSVFIAPVVAFVAVLSGLPRVRGPEQTRRLLLGLTSSLYVVLVGVLIRTLSPAIQNFLLVEESVPPASPARYYPWPEVDMVFGQGPPLVFALVVLATAWIVAGNRSARRLSIFFPLVLLVGFFNPLVAPLLRANVTSPFVYWRVLWILPFPTMVALVVMSPLVWRRWNTPLFLRRSAFAGLLLAAAALGGGSIYSAQNNGTRIAWPSLKVARHYDVAATWVQLLERQTGDPPVIVGPIAVTVWIPTFRHHPLPLMARGKFYFHTFADDGSRRLQLKRYVSGGVRPNNGPELLRAEIEAFDIGSVCLRRSVPWADEIRGVLMAESFTLQEVVSGFELWIEDSQIVTSQLHLDSRPIGLGFPSVAGSRRAESGA